MHIRKPEETRGLYHRLYQIFLSEKSVAIIAIGLVCFMALFANEAFKNHVRQEVDDSLQRALGSTTNSIDVWRNDQVRVTNTYAGNDHVVDLTRQLLSGASDSGSLQRSAVQGALRGVFTVAQDQQLVTEFFILAPDNTNLAASSDEDIGVDNILTSKPEILSKLWSGEIPLTRLAGNNKTLGGEPDEAAVSQRVSILFAAPIRNRENQIIALLLLRKSPFDHVFELFQSGSFGKTGRMSGFDKEGRALSQLQFQRESSDSPIISHTTGGEMPVIIPEQNTSAVKKGGKNLDGYVDHRGVSQVAAWHWFSDAGIGIVALQTEAEAYSNSYVVRDLLYVSCAAVSLLILALYFLFQNRRREVTKARTHLEAIYRSSLDSQVVIDTKGIIHSFNPTTEKIFGYSAEQLRGQNISMLMPEPHRSEHDEYLAHYTVSEKHPSQSSRVFDIQRETEALRKDGTTFPIDIHVTTLTLDGEEYFAGSLRDISERKRSEQQIREKERRLRNILQHAHLGTWEWRIGTTHVEYDSQVSRTLRLPENFIPSSMNLLTFVHGDDRRALRSALFKCLRTRKEFSSEHRVVRHDGTVGWVLMQGSIKCDETGDPSHLQGLIQDVTERKEMAQQLVTSEQALRESENHLNNMLNTAPALIRIKDLDGRYTFANPACTRLTDKTVQDYIGATDEDLYPADVARFTRQNDQLVIEGGKPLQVEKHLELDSGNIWLLISLFPLSDSEGNIYAVGSLSTDITELKETQRELEISRQRADDSNRAKSTFLATMSHEIRTPMNGIVGMLDVLRRMPPGEDQGKMLSTINDSAFTLLDIIDEILDFSKVEAGKIELEKTPVTLENILDSVGQTLLPIAANKNIDLITFCDPFLPQYSGDPGRIRQILYNLVGNAIKFTSTTPEKHGQVMVSIEPGVSASGSESILFKVADNGIGIGAQEQQELFNPFTQAESSITRQYGGTGLGLSISKRLCELMGGDILVDSELGVGTVFTVALSLPACSEPDLNRDTALENTTVLFLTEDDSVCDFISRYLQCSRVKLREAPSSQIANLPMQQLQGASELVVIVVETHSHGEHANTLLEQLRTQLPAPLHPSFVVVSRGRRRDVRRTASDTLQIDYSSLSRRTFIDIVSVAAGLTLESAGPDQLSRRSSAPVTGITEIADHDRHWLLVAEDNPVNQKVIVHQLGLMGLKADVADDGEEALNLWSEARDKYSLLLTDCHMPKMDGYSLTEAIRELEQGDSRLPIIAATADAMSTTRQQCLDAGMDDYISKPLLVEVLSAKLAAWLPVLSKVDETPAVEAPSMEDVVTTVETNNSSDEVINPKALSELLGSDDPDLLAEFYHEFLKSASPTVEEMCHAIGEGSVKEVSALAHKLKSSAISVGAQAFYECCLQMESWGKSGDSTLLKQNKEKLRLHMEQARDWILQHYPPG